MKFKKKLFTLLLGGGILAAGAVAAPLIITSCSSGEEAPATNQGKQVATLKTFDGNTTTTVDSNKSFNVNLSPSEGSTLGKLTGWEYSSNGNSDWKVFDNNNYRVDEVAKTRINNTLVNLTNGEVPATPAFTKDLTSATQNDKLVITATGDNLTTTNLKWYLDDSTKPTNQINADSNNGIEITVKGNTIELSIALNEANVNKYNGHKIIAKLDSVEGTNGIKEISISGLVVPGTPATPEGTITYSITIKNPSTTNTLTTYIRAKFGNDYSNALKVTVNKSSQGPTAQ